MADNSDVDSEKIEEIVADVIDDLDRSSIGVNNAAYSRDKSDLVLDMIFRRRSRISGDDDEYESEDDDRVVLPREIMFEEHRRDSPLRKLSSRSWCLPEKQRDESLLRKRSDSHILYPPSQRSEPESYVLPNEKLAVNGNPKQPSVLQFSNNNDFEQNHSKCPSVMIIHNNESSCDENSPSIEHSSTSPNALQPPMVSATHELPPPSHGNFYYNSSTSSSFQSPSDEKREFSPLSSQTSENTDDFPGCDESLESQLTNPVDSRNKLVSNSQENDRRESVSRGQSNRPHIATSPVIVIQNPLDTSLSALDLDSTDPNKQMYSSPKYDPAVQESYKVKGPQQMTMPRSKPTGLFSLKTPQNNGADLLDLKYKSALSPDIDYTVIGIPTDRDRRRESSLSDVGISNGVFTIEGSNGQGVMKALRKSSDVSPIRTPSQMSQQQNNTRRTKSYDKSSRDNFKQNIKLKDNRVKSTLRKHAMSGCHSHLPADFIDECTLEALSKEDVLILWKKSEIDLESRLHEVLARNRRLSVAIDYLTRRDRSGEPEEV